LRGDLSSEAPLAAGDSVVRSAAAAGSIYFESEQFERTRDSRDICLRQALLRKKYKAKSKATTTTLLRLDGEYNKHHGTTINSIQIIHR
jgi:hypothetical protein